MTCQNATGSLTPAACCGALARTRRAG